MLAMYAANNILAFLSWNEELAAGWYIAAIPPFIGLDGEFLLFLMEYLQLVNIQIDSNRLSRDFDHAATRRPLGFMRGCTHHHPTKTFLAISVLASETAHVSTAKCDGFHDAFLPYCVGILIKAA